MCVHMFFEMKQKNMYRGSVLALGPDDIKNICLKISADFRNL